MGNIMFETCYLLLLRNTLLVEHQIKTSN